MADQDTPGVLRFTNVHRDYRRMKLTRALPHTTHTAYHPRHHHDDGALWPSCGRYACASGYSRVNN
jgi:hypothetical protein